MDAVSGLAVRLLELRHDEHFLDLCCAPGTKLTLARLLQMAQEGEQGIRKCIGSATGVDISMGRLSTTRALVKKYGLSRTRLLCEDGSKPLWVGPHLLYTDSHERPYVYAKVHEELNLAVHPLSPDTLSSHLGLPKEARRPG